MAITFRSPVTVELRRSWDPPAPVGIFQVTQRFDTPDYYASQRVPPPNPLPTHGATDIGDKRCGAPIVAMAPGIAWRVQDNATAFGAATNALGIRIDHGEGVVSEYWHLASWTAPHGSAVTAGQEIGRLGNTGLLATCHCHIEVKINGVKIDPEPLMFGGTLGEDMQIPPGTQVIAQGSVPPQAALRSSPAVADDNIIRRTETETQLAILWVMPGQGYYVKDGKQYRDWLAVALGEGIAYVAKEFVSNIFVTAAGQTIIPTQVASGITQAQLKAARDEGFADAKGKAKAGSNAAIEGIAP